MRGILESQTSARIFASSSCSEMFTPILSKRDETGPDSRSFDTLSEDQLKGSGLGRVDCGGSTPGVYSGGEGCSVAGCPGCHPPEKYCACEDVTNASEARRIEVSFMREVVRVRDSVVCSPFSTRSALRSNVSGTIRWP